MLKASPSIARHVRSFCFTWQMSSFDLYWCNDWDATYATLLEMAFSDRFSTWDSLRESLGCEPTWTSDGAIDELSFTHRGKTYRAPGNSPCEYNMRRIIVDHDAPREGTSGPDGKGEDGLIKTPEQLQDCMVEIVRSFTSLETLGWSTFMPMPQGVFDTLASLTTLSSLRINLRSYRSTLHACESVPSQQNVCALMSNRLHFPYHSAVLGPRRQHRKSVFGHGERSECE